MELYLVQHAEAESKEDDPERPLTAEGFANTRRMADYAARLGVRVDEIHHSGKTRARQTAEGFAAALGAPVSDSERLSPNDDVEPLARDLTKRAESLMIVGHLPHLARLASTLLAGADTPNLVSFRNAGIVRLDRNAEGHFELRWAIPPETVVH